MSFDEQPDGDPHGECAAEIARLEAELAAEKMQHSVTIAEEHESRSEFQDRLGALEANLAAELALRQTAEGYAARNALRVIEVEAALRKIVRDGDYTAPEGMKRIANEALATELETFAEPAIDQAPIARVIVTDDAPADVVLYAPGLPPGEFDVYLEPTKTKGEQM